MGNKSVRCATRANRCKAALTTHRTSARPYHHPVRAPRAAANQPPAPKLTAPVAVTKDQLA